MLRIARFAKPFLGSVALAILLLLGQALCDLNLPNLMSDIVNVGIQQGGVEDRSPVALSSDGFSLITTFLDSDQQTLLKDNYEFVRPGDQDANGKPWSDRYPDASADGFYVLKANVDADTRAQLDDAFGLSTWTMVKVLQEFAANGVENLGIQLPPGVTLDMLASGSSTNTSAGFADITAGSATGGAADATAGSADTSAAAATEAGGTAAASTDPASAAATAYAAAISAGAPLKMLPVRPLPQLWRLVPHLSMPPRPSMPLP